MVLQVAGVKVVLDQTRVFTDNAAANARAMRAGSAADATAVFNRMASKPISMAPAACEGAPMPASRQICSVLR